MLHFFMESTAAAGLNARNALKSKLHKRLNEGTVMVSCEAVNWLLENYPTDDITAETNADMMRITQLSKKSPTECAKC